MCGRYTLFGNWKSSLPPATITDEFIEFQDVIDNYNVTPLQTMPILTAVNTDIHATAMRWGFVPGWSKESSPQGMINARSETVAEKPSFRHAFKQRRCLIPMNGFYEWASSPSGKKQPVYCSSSTGELLFAAGIWEHWTSPDEHMAFDAFAIITVPANSMMRVFHERMPAFIDKENIQSWLFDSECAASLLIPKPSSQCKSVYVGSGVNNARANNADLILECPPFVKQEEILSTKPPSGGRNSRKSDDNSQQGALF